MAFHDFLFHHNFTALATWNGISSFFSHHYLASTMLRISVWHISTFFIKSDIQGGKIKLNKEASIVNFYKPHFQKLQPYILSQLSVLLAMVW